MFKKIISKRIPLKYRVLYRKIKRSKRDREILKRLESTVGDLRYILILTPEYSNIGDHAITIAEKEFMKNYFPKYTAIEIPLETWRFYKDKIKKHIKKEECLLVHGGGFLGTLWMGGETCFRELLQYFPYNNILVFPQSLYFENNEESVRELEKSKKIYSSHEKLFLCLREQSSYNRVKGYSLLNEKAKSYLFPDIVTYLDRYAISHQRKSHVLFCLRNDKERILDIKERKEIVTKIEKLNLDYRFTDTVIDNEIPWNNRELHFEKKIKEFLESAIVITDRLHGMVFAAISGTPCLFLDNCSNKVSGTYEWLKYLDYIKPMKDINDMEQFIIKYSGISVSKYNNDILKGYYDELAKIIGGFYNE